MCRLGFLLFLLGVMASDAVGSERAKFVGSWASTYPLTRGESNTLNISDTLEVKFIRDFGNSPKKQEFDGTTKSLQFIDDLLIIDFSRYSSEATYKLVLAVIKSTQHELVMVGTAYMYLDGTMVSGMHLALHKLDE